MNDRIKNFVEYVSSDEALKTELKSNLDGKDEKEMISNFIQFAKKHGYELNEEDFAAKSGELGDGELEAVVGGSGCGCPVIGGGNGDGMFCICGLGGTGGVDGNITPSSQGGCICIWAGAGATNRH